MANRTDPDAATVHGTNPQTLVEKIVRSKIHECTFWKESCFALNAESLVDRGAQLRAVGGARRAGLRGGPLVRAVTPARQRLHLT